MLDPDTSITQSLDTVRQADTPRNLESSEATSANGVQEVSSSESEPFHLNQLEITEETEKDSLQNDERRLGPFNLALNANNCQCSCFPAFMSLFKK